MKNYIALSDKEKLTIFNQASTTSVLPASAIEKDWWVTLVLNIIFTSSEAEHIVFKGGTSLSKAYDLIARFSEDIDLAINRERLGYGGDLSNTQIKKLRKASFTFISTTFREAIQTKLDEYGLKNCELKVQETTDSDKDPLIIDLHYQPLTSTSEYLKPRVQIEVGQDP